MKRVFTGGICVVGMGRWGSSLMAALRSKGLSAVSADPRKAATSRRHTRWTQAEIFWLCVPDSQIQAAGKMVVKGVEMAGRPENRLILLHSSGVYGNEILDFARVKGALVGSVHPMMSFPTRKPVPLDGIPFAIEAEGRLKARLFQLIRVLGGKPFPVRAEGKPLYHAAAVMASPLLVGLASAAVEIARLSGLSARESAVLLQPIMTATLAGFFRQGSAGGVSGPFVRGDAQTVSLHLEALELHPELQQVYRSLALFVVDSLPAVNQRQLRKTLVADKRGVLPKPNLNR